MKYALSLIVETTSGEKKISETWECADIQAVHTEHENQRRFVIGRLKAGIALSKREDVSNIPNFYEKVVTDLIKIFGEEDITMWYFEYTNIPQNTDSTEKNLELNNG